MRTSSLPALFAFATGVLVLSLNPAWSQPTRAWHLVEEGMKKSREGDVDAAMAMYSKAIELEPKNPYAFSNRGACKCEKGDLEGAIRDCTRAIQIDPKHGGAFYNRGHAYRKNGDALAALRDFSKTIELEPTNVNALAERGTLHFHARSWTNALADFRRGCELGDPEQDYIRARIWIIQSRLGKKQAATQELREYLNLARPKAGKADEDFARVADFLTGKLSEPDFLRAASSEDPVEDKERKCDAYYHVGMMRLIDHDKTKAIEFLEKCVATGATDLIEHASAVAELRAIKNEK